MAINRAMTWSRQNLPKVAYIAMTAAGMIFIWIAKLHIWTASYTIGVPLALMGSYFLIAAVLAGFRFHDEQAGDNLYYMGFLFTLTSLGVSLYRFNAAASVDGIVRDFGLAVSTTICGIGLRILYNQVRRDPIDIERSTRHELAEMTRRVRVELEAASREFSNFRRVSNQMLEEGFEEIGRQAQQSGQQILKIMESLTQEAVKPIAAAGEQIQSILDEVGQKTGARLTDSAERMETSTKSLEEANVRMADTVRGFGEHVEATGSKLAQIKTPDEVVTLKLRPTLATLEKLVKAQSESTAASDEDRNRQIGAIQQTHQTIEKLAAAVERSVAAMDKAVEATGHSQRATENLMRLVQQQNSEMKEHLEKLSGEHNESLSRKIIEEVSARLSPRPNQTAYAPQPQSGGSAEAQTFGAPSAVAPHTDESDRARTEEKKWWSLR